jgi:RNA polymerase sigma-70 factor (ECF subfamily)
MRVKVEPQVTHHEADAESGGSEPDVQLALRAAQGDVPAFERIMRRYNQRLFRLACGIVNEASEAEDVLQESYVRAFYSLPKFTGRGSLGAWLAQIVRHEAIDRLRARAVQRKYISLEAELSSPDDDPVLERSEAPLDDVRFNPQAATENSQMKRVLEDAIQQLPDSFRSVFMLREVEGLSIEETAEYLGIPAATVKTRDHRARNLLKQHLGERIDTTIPQTFAFLSTRCDSLVARVLKRLQQ